jgi:uncharacterized membrane protein YccC
MGIEQAFRCELQWMKRDPGNGRKLSTLRFVSESFERQLTRTRVVADHGGYMHLITDAKPCLASEVKSLRNAREELQSDFERIIVRFERVSFDDSAGFRKICAELERYLDHLKVHGQKETELLQRSVNQKEAELDERSRARRYACCTSRQDGSRPIFTASLDRRAT